MEDMSRYHVNVEDLAQTRAMIEALYDKLRQQLQKIGEAQYATYERDEARKELKAWMSRFKKTACVAYSMKRNCLKHWKSKYQIK